MNDLEKKVDELICKIDNIMNELCESSKVCRSELFIQTKAVEKAITELAKSGLQVPENLKQVKIDLLNRLSDADRMDELTSRLLRKFEEYTLNSKSKDRKFNINTQYVRSKYTKKKIISFKFLDNEYPLKSWIDLIPLVCGLMYKKHPDIFDKIFFIRGNKRKYFSKTKSEIDRAKYLEGLNIFYEYKLSANMIGTIIERIMDGFNYTRDEWEICYEDK